MRRCRTKTSASLSGTRSPSSNTRFRPITAEEAKALALEWLVAGESWVSEIVYDEIADAAGRIARWKESKWRPAVVRSDKVDGGDHRLVPENPNVGDYVCCSQAIYDDDEDGH